MLRMVLFALLAACGNALFVYGQRSSANSANPFLFTLCALTLCAGMFLAAALIWQTPGDPAYVAANWPNMIVSGSGFFLTFLGFYLLFTNYGASQYALYAVLSILTTSLGVGVVIFREPLNTYQGAAMALAVLAITLWTYGRSIGATG